MGFTNYLFLSVEWNYEYETPLGYIGRIIFLPFIVIDEDWLDGPWGTRGKRRERRDKIPPLLTDSQLYNEFCEYAINVLKIDDFT